VVWSVGKMVRGRSGTKSFGARVRHDLSDFTLRANRPLPFQLDGDRVEDTDFVHFTATTRALRLYV
jgi:diacylglycerol kinase family enzyme